MTGRKVSAIISITYLILVDSMCFMLFYFSKYGKGGIAFMTQEAADIVALTAAITSLVGIVAVVISQIVFYRKDSQTMSEIKQDVSDGNIRLSDRLDLKEKNMSAEHNDIRDIVKEIQVKQEFEIKLQEKIRDTVPDAGMIKDGIDKICQENVKLREEISTLKQQIEYLQEKNKELIQSNKQLLKRAEREHEPLEDIEI